MQVINKQKLKDKVFASLQDAILSGSLRVGERIVETQVALNLGVSQATIREALKDLEHFGLVEKKPYQGTYVKQLDKKELRDAYDARMVLEVYTAEMAAKCISQEQLETIRELMRGMSMAAAAGDAKTFSDYNVRFHEAIIDSCGNKMVKKLWHLANVSLWTLVATNVSKRTLNNLAARHINIMRALENRDPDGARVAIQAHLVELRDEMIGSIK